MARTPTSGTPKTPSTKQERLAARQEKLAELKRQQARTKRNRLVGLIVGGTAAVAAVTLVIVFVVTSGSSTAPTASSITGVKTYDGLTSNHVAGTVDYAQTPPAGGDHNQVWLNCGVYSEQVPSENAVHDLEHGAVWITYDPDQVSDAEVTALRKVVPTTYAVLSPFPGLDKPMYISAWGAQLGFSKADDPRVEQFITKYWQTSTAPEPGAPCTGGVDGPGKIA
ncbi:uncharacterized protein DUF3105 [Frondihabitans sp. PhB188]|uniref:DUF3105 domain-containing protein n=1 Tax=Frondihabitans sp. PhB188 TaxID=2485200 RepID=UPI000FC33F0E|nr:DUF3105 domain-containing protein [Frondihabitans sp. PhB188]ROQ38713.1 uncharacterized protein DUF3105 [Frondihabitans sp. PhB188]